MTTSAPARLRSLAATAALTLTAAASPAAHAATQEELEAKLDALAAQVAELESQLAERRVERTESDAPAAAAAPPAGLEAAEAEQNVVWFGYGELDYSRPEDDGSVTTADLARFVLGASYR